METFENGFHLTAADYWTAKEKGIPYHTAYERFHKYGWDRQRTITEEVGKLPEWEKYKEQALANKVSYGMFMRRRKKGMTPEQAISLGRLNLNGPVKLPESMYKKAEGLGISRGTMKNLVYRMGMSAEDALNEALKKAN